MRSRSSPEFRRIPIPDSRAHVTDPHHSNGLFAATSNANEHVALRRRSGNVLIMLAARERLRHPIASMAIVFAALTAAGAPLWYAYHDDTRSRLAVAASYALVIASSSVLAFGRSTGAQLLARAIWWSAFASGGLTAGFAAEIHDLAVTGLVMTLATSTALLVAGRRGLDRDALGFAPAAYRAPILISMIMALADAQGVGWLGISRLCFALTYDIDGGFVGQAVAMLACSTVALVAVYGLYRLHLWGFVLSVISTLAIGILAFTPVLGLPAGPIPYAFAASAAVQLALLVPLFIAIIRRRAPAPPGPRSARLATIAPALIVVVAATLAIITVVTERSLVRF